MIQPGDFTSEAKEDTLKKNARAECAEIKERAGSKFLYNQVYPTILELFKQIVDDYPEEASYLSPKPFLCKSPA